MRFAQPVLERALRRLLFGVLALLAGATVSGFGAKAQDLPRRPFLGIAMESGEGPAVLVERVIEGSSAAAADIRPGDVIVSVDGRPVARALPTSSPPCKPRRAERPSRHRGQPRWNNACQGRCPGRSAARNGRGLRHALRGGGCRWRSAPHHPDASCRQRPASGSPVCRRNRLLQHGIALRRGRGLPPAPLLHHPARLRHHARAKRAAWATAAAAPCASVDLANELGGYMAGLQALRSKPYVDAERIFIVGHSIGGIVGPLLAVEDAGQGHRGDGDGRHDLVRIRAHQSPPPAEARRRTAPAALGRAMQLKQWCMHRLLIERQPRQEMPGGEARMCRRDRAAGAPMPICSRSPNWSLPGALGRIETGDTLLVYGELPTS